MKTTQQSRQASPYNRFYSWALLTASASAIVLPMAVHANPTGGTVAAGTATIVNTTPNLTNINQSTDKAIINWDTFNIAPNQTTNFNQPGTGSATLNRIGDANPSQILGSLNANGHLMLINPNGMMFGQNAQVNVGSLTASTADMDDEAFMNATGAIGFNKAGNADASIVNNGNIRANNGFAALVAPNVTNNGTIRAQAGKVALAGSDVFTLDPTGDQLVNFALPEGTAAEGDAATSVAVNQNGTVIANQGSVELTASQADAVVDSVVNMNGLTRARSSNATEGKITLTGGDVDIAGTLDAKANGSNANGGSIEATAGNHLSFTGEANATGNGTGNGGTIAMSGETMSLGGTTDTSAGGTGTAGTTSYHTNGTFTVDDLAAYSIGEGLGTNSNVEVSSNGQIDVNSAIDSSAQTNTSGLKLVDGDANGDLTVNLNNKITGGVNQSLSGEATTVNVSADGSIQNGVDVSSENGSTVNVAAGTFDEDVTVENDNISLMGNNAGQSAVDFLSRADESIINGNVDISGDNTVLDGFTVAGDAGVMVHDADNVQVLNNNIESEGMSEVATLTTDESAALTFANSNGSTASGNYAEGYDIGVHATNSDNLTVADNEIYAAKAIKAEGSNNLSVTGNELDGGFGAVQGETGISLNNSHDATIDDNSLEDFATGVDVRNSDNAQITDNKIEGADAGGSYTGQTAVNLVNANEANIRRNDISEYDLGIKGRNSNDVTIRNNDIAATDGIDVANSDNLQVSLNEMTGAEEGESGATAIRLNNTDNAVVRDNVIARYTNGIDVRNSDGVNVADNELTEVENGITLRNADESLVRGNDITGLGEETGTGIQVFNSGNVRVRYNTVASADRGIDVRNSDNTELLENEVSDVNTGVFANNADNMTATGNTLTGQGSTGNGFDIRNSDNVDLTGGNTISGFQTAVKKTNSTVNE